MNNSLAKSFRQTFCLLGILCLLQQPSFGQVVGGEWQTIYQFDAAMSGEGLGISVSGAGDVNADGFDDLIVGAWRANGGGSAYVYSGADGTLLHHWNGAAAGERFGYSVAGAGDVDADGFEDLIIGAKWANYTAGSAYVYSGADGALLHRWNGASNYDEMGYSVSRAGDVNADGFDDLIVGATGVNPRGLYNAGSAYVRSGADGTLLHRFNGADDRNHLGISVSGAGDVNADGFADLIVGAFGTNPGGHQEAGSAYVHSGADGTLLHRFNGAAGGDQMGWSVSGAGDVNADGFDDLIVGAKSTDPGGITDAGSAYVYSGADGSLLHQWNGATPYAEMGRSVSGAGDVNADGFDDLIAGAWRAKNRGEAYVYNFAPFLKSSASEISSSAGGMIELQLDFPDQAAGYTYKVLASASGTGPTVYGVEIPLTEDVPFRRSWFGLHDGIQQGKLHGVLDYEGKASARFKITAGNWASLIGIQFHSAAVAINPSGIPEFSSIAIPFKIVP